MADKFLKPRFFSFIRPTVNSKRPRDLQTTVPEFSAQRLFNTRTLYIILILLWSYVYIFITRVFLIIIDCFS